MERRNIGTIGRVINPINIWKFIGKISVSDIFKCSQDCSFRVVHQRDCSPSYFIAGATWALATDCRSMKLKDCVCVEDLMMRVMKIRYFYDCNVNVEYARRFMDEFVLHMRNDFYECLSYNNSICAYNVI